MKKQSVWLLAWLVLSAFSPAWGEARLKKDVHVAFARTNENLSNENNHPLANGIQAKAPATGRELWGNIISRASWEDTGDENGLYSFNASSPLAFETIAQNFRMNANGGSAFVDGVWHFLYFYTSWGVTLTYHYSFDAETWDLIDSGTLVSNGGLLATETTTADDGTVYGEFYNSEGTGFELGIVDYKNLTRTTIGELKQHYVALGITKDKVLYGISTNGDLYKISADDATETKVGSTGISLLPSSGTPYLQSGEIDPKTGVFYWAAVDSDKKSALYTVNLDDGALTKVADFSDSEVIVGLTVPKPEAEDGAPAALSDLAVSFEGPSLTGRFSFTAPDKTFSGGQLEGDLSYYIVANDDTLATGTAKPGGKVERDVTVKDNGKQRFYVTTQNGIGSSPKTKVLKYVGYDTPEAPSDVELEINSKDGTAKLSWTKPSKGLNDAYIGTLKYDIVRYPDSLKVGQAIADTTFTETLPKNALQFYKYGVVACNDTMRSSERMSNGVAFGKAMATPYLEDFSNEDDFNFFTVIDVNADKRTWGWYWGRNGESPSARYTYSSRNAADDWLISPPIALKGGREYTLSFKARTSTTKYSVEEERFEVKYGQGTTVADMAETIIPPTVISNSVDSVITASIVAKEDKDVNIGIHSISDSYQYYWFIDDLAIDEGQSLATPDSVSGFSVASGDKGAHTAKLTFTLPAKDRKGDMLSGGITKVIVVRDDSIAVDTLTDGLDAGHTISYTDIEAPAGLHHYTVVAYNANGKGRIAPRKSVFVGVDTPVAVDESAIKAVGDSSSVEISWNPVSTGQNGGYIDPAELWYTVYNTSGNVPKEAVDSVKGTDHISISIGGSSEQTLGKYAVTVKNATGESNMAYVRPLVTGKPYALPFAESFKLGRKAGLWWSPDASADSEWGTITTVPDGDDGALAFLGKGDLAIINTGKISLRGASNPKLKFSIRPDSSLAAKIHVYVQNPDGTADSLATVDFDGSKSWRRISVPLKQYAEKPYIMLSFRGEGTTTDYAYVDSVNVRDFKENDLAVSLNVAKHLRKGESSNATVRVANLGEKPADGYSVILKAGEEIVGNRQSPSVLHTLDGETFDFAFVPSVFYESDSLELTAEVVFNGDENPIDNIASAKSVVSESVKPSPRLATAKQNGVAVEINWAAPVDPKDEVTEGFEDYDSWSIDNFGAWTGVDGDKGASGSMFKGYPYEHIGHPFAFIVFAPEEVDPSIPESYESFAPKFGKQYAASVYSVKDDKYPDADNWLISPLLSGDAQTVKFYANNYKASASKAYPEDVVLLYSTGSSDTAQFVPIDTVLVEGGEWQELSFDVPDGAKRFAIRHITKEGGYALMIDSVVFQSGMGEVAGYNIYRNGQLAGTVAAGETQYIDDAAIADGERRSYAVTALYSDGESLPANADEIVVTGITNLHEEEDKPNKIYSIDGRLIHANPSQLNKLQRGVYIIGGRKVVVK